MLLLLPRRDAENVYTNINNSLQQRNDGDDDDTAQFRTNNGNRNATQPIPILVVSVGLARSELGDFVGRCLPTADAASAAVA